MKSLSCSDVESNTLSKQEMEHWTCLNCIYIHFSTCFYKKEPHNVLQVIHYSCLFALFAKIKI